VGVREGCSYRTAHPACESDAAPDAARVFGSRPDIPNGLRDPVRGDLHLVYLSSRIFLRFRIAFSAALAAPDENSVFALAPPFLGGYVRFVSPLIEA